MNNDQLHKQLMGYIKSWVDGTKLWRLQAKMDLDYVNGKQEEALKGLINKAKPTNPIITNEIRPQAETMAGLQRAQDFQYLPVPRGREDGRLAEVCEATLKAVYDYAKEARASAKVFDDGTAAGLGVSYIGTSLDDADDLVWGDLFIERINQFSFIFDIWSTPPEFQDGLFQGHLRWMSRDAFKAAYPKQEIPPVDSWNEALKDLFYGETPSMTEEMLNKNEDHIRVAMLYYKVPIQIWIVVDESNGDVYDGSNSKKKAHTKLTELVQEQADRLMEGIEPLAQTTDEGIVFVVVNAEGSPQLDEQTQLPKVFSTLEGAQGAITAQHRQLSDEIRQAYTVIKRSVNVIKWASFTAFGILETGAKETTSRAFPYAVYLQRQWGDEIEDIEGVPRQIRGRQDQVNKRHNYIDLNLAHSANGGWLNKKHDGADQRQLELFGSQPGVVIPWGTVRPEQIQASNIPVGHFTLLQEAIAGIPRATGLNNELSALTSNSTVSGLAIGRRQQGGQLANAARLEGFGDYKLDLAMRVLEEIQLNMPEKKIRRIVGAWAAKNPDATIFYDPVSSEPLSDSEITALLVSFKSTRYDLGYKPAAPDESARQMEFQRQLELAQIITASGRTIGSKLYGEILGAANVSEAFKSAALADLAKEQEALAAQQQNQQIQQVLGQLKGRGNEGTNV